MRSPYDYIVKPLGGRYNNTVEVGGKKLITNTEIFEHKYTNRIAEVIQVPLWNTLPIKQYDKVVLHHNVFRRMLTIKGKEVNSKSFLRDGEFIIRPDQIFMYGDVGAWKPIKGYTFVQPIKIKTCSLLKKKNL